MSFRMMMLLLSVVVSSYGKDNFVSVSVVIPCSHNHFQHIETLLTHYAHQTLVPQEVIISVSNSYSLKPGEIPKVQTRPWPFKLKIMQTPSRMLPSENRNNATQYATGDLIIYQDADDLPHPQRVEIIDYIFRKTHFSHLRHQYVSDLYGTVDTQKFFEASYDPAGIKVLMSHDKSDRVMYKHSTSIHYGNCAISKKVFGKIQWPVMVFGEDREFCNKIEKKYHNSVIIQVPLMIYRTNLSAISN